MAYDVLIVDDDKEVLDVLEMYCENLVCFRNIIKANDGVMASGKIRNQEFCLILLDIHMPKKSGTDLVKEISNTGVSSLNSVIIVSGELDKKVITEVMSRGVKHFMVKPFDEEGFKAKVKQVLSKTAPEIASQI